MVAKTFRCKLILCVAQANPTFDTHTLFDIQYKESTDSPVDEFLLRLNAINKLAPQPNNFDPFQGQLVLLGVVAAVESYIRTLFRRLIAIDETCQQSVNMQDVSYGAAMHLSKSMLPEAILERSSFVSHRSIHEAMKDLLAVKGAFPADLESAIKEYVRVCQLRHCAVHRFGKLGVNNAISLGLTDHKNLLEKPLRLDYTALQNTIAISTNMVKTLNNFLFNEMVSRLPAASWTKQYSVDKPLFIRYYDMFSDKVSSNRSAIPSQIYAQFIRQQAMFAAGTSF